MSLTQKIFFIVSLVVGSLSAAWGQAVPQSLVECAEHREDSRRLSCYDSEIARLLARAASVASTQVPAVADVPTPPVVAPTPRLESPSREDEFGLSGELARQRQKEEQPTERPLEELDAVVAKVTTKAYGELVFELDNGQVWEQPEKKFGMFIKAGEKVHIKKGAIGSYFLTAESGATTRVRRTR